VVTKKIILLSGTQGAGKTTQSELLKKLAVVYDYVPRVFKFAEPLYEMHNACLPILKKYGIIPETMTKDGELLQVLGTEYGRRYRGEKVWVNVCRKRVDEWLALSDNHIGIIDDCRFPNEVDGFTDALCIRLDAPEEMRKERCSYWREGHHESETALDEYVRTGKFSGLWSGIMSTEVVRPEITAQRIWERLSTGFKF
jgi:hypothetical protein